MNLEGRLELPRSTSGRVTLADVARFVGVSEGTVSMVINNRPGVAAETRKKVLDAVEKLRYVPNEMARSISTLTTRTIGLLVHNIADPFYAPVVDTMINETRRRSYGWRIATSEGQVCFQHDAVQLLLRKHVDGIIVFPYTNATDFSWLHTLRTNGIPFVILGTPLYGIEADYIYNADREGAFRACEHLLELGHRRIAFLAGPAASGSSSERLLGYSEALTSRGIRPDPRLVLQAGETLREGYEVAVRFLSHIADWEHPPTAVMCYNDSVALGVLKAAREAGLTIPRDMSVIGFNNIEFSEVSCPPLSTVNIDKAALALKAVETLLKRIELGQAMPYQRLEIPTSFVQRESTSPAPG